MEKEEFEWDEAKAQSNWRKHGVDFETACEAFEDLFAIEELDQEHLVYGEFRYRLVGMSNGNLLTVIYTERERRVRIISARRASRREHDDYYRANSKE